MPETPKPVLTDPEDEPTDAIVHRHLGAATPLWDELFERIRTRQPPLDAQWRYYRDGNSWLLKVTRGSRTICWLSVSDGFFRLTAYLPARAEEAVVSSGLREDLKRQFLEAGSARTRGITVVFDEQGDDGAIDAAQDLMALREGFR